MPTRQEVPINSQILRWARERAQLTPEEASARAGIRDLRIRGLPAKDRLLIWESGQEKPTLNELELIAKAYRRPIITFFLPEPPVIQTGLQDFRTVADRPLVKTSPEFDAFRRQVEVLQKEVRALVESENRAPLEFIGTTTMATHPSTMAEMIRQKLEFSFVDQQRVRNSDDLFGVLREKAEKLGVFILRKADLGNWHSRITTEEFRGLVICDRIAPFVVVNPNDAKVAQPFTLIHELVHLWLGESGISSFNILEARITNYQEREVYCNKAAAELLVPERVFLTYWQRVRTQRLDSAIESLATEFKVSRVVVARRLLDLGRVNEEEYWTQYNQWRTEWSDQSEEQRHEGGGPSYFINMKSKLGIKLLDTVIKAAYDGKISYGEASKILGIKIDYFAQFYKG
ncbi:MAG: XRE family transcriptional regulator [Dehalococcoidia bacterium]|nr:XRE family transcriptional regulator [Dehalococcoidia bacterium]